MPWYEVVKFILECLSYIAALSLVFIGVYGLNQLKIAKNSLHTQSLRDAKKAASEQVIYFLEEVLEKSEIQKSVTQHDLDLIESFKFDSKNENKVDIQKMIQFDSKYTEENVEKYIEDVDNAVVSVYPNLLNRMEAFSASVLSGVGDEKLVYESVGVTFVGLLRTTSLIEYATQKNNTGLYYQKTKRLYKLWSARYTKELTEAMLKDLTTEHKDASKELATLKRKIDSIVAEEIPPIGVNVAIIPKTSRTKPSKKSK